MKWIPIAALIMLVMIANFSQANAQTISTNCQRGSGAFNCTTTFLRLPPAGPQIIQRDEFNVVRDQQWLLFCKPVIHVDKYGVERYFYAHSGCENGRMQ